MKKELALAIVLVALTGCGFWRDKAETETTTAGSRPLEISYEKVDLVRLLDPEGNAKAAYLKANPKPVTENNSTETSWDSLVEHQQIELALAQYHAREFALKDVDEQKRLRNQTQERMLGASNQMCYRYRLYLQNIQSSSNFLFGALTSAAGAAGAIVTGGASQILAGAASALTGVRAEFNQDFFQGITVATIWKGIEARRKKAFETIAKDGQSKDTKEYTVEAALKDAINYHGECSLVAGIEELGVSVDRLAQDPGLDAVARTLLKMNIARNIVESKSVDPADLLGDALPGSPAAQFLGYGTPLGSDDALTGGDASEAFGLTVHGIQKESASALKAVDEFKHWPEGVAEVGGKKFDSYRLLAADAIRTRAAKASTQVVACQGAALASSQAVLAAQADLAGATDANQREKLVALQTRILESQARANEIVPARKWLKTDLETFIANLKSEDELAEQRESKRMEGSAVSGAATRLYAASESLGDLSCAAKTKEVEEDANGEAETPTPPSN